MSLKIAVIAVVFGLTVALPPAAVVAQTDDSTTGKSDAPAKPDKVFRLSRDTDTAAKDLVDDEMAALAWEPAIKPGSVEVSMSLGFMNLASTLLEHNQIIYKYTTESTYWGDVKITGQTAFNPIMRVGYTVNPWLTFEGYGGLSLSEYSATVTNRFTAKNKPGADVDADPPLGEFDPETRSLISLQAGLDCIVYPLNIRGDGKGRMHPFVIGTAGGIWYDMNSNFTAGAAAASDYGLGGGLRVLADRNVSLRLEATYHLNTVEFTPAQFFAELNQGTTRVPLNEYLIPGSAQESRVTKFTAQDVNYLAWSIGIHGSF